MRLKYFSFTNVFFYMHLFCTYCARVGLLLLTLHADVRLERWEDVSRRVAMTTEQRQWFIDVGVVNAQREFSSWRPGRRERAARARWISARRGRAARTRLRLVPVVDGRLEEGLKGKWRQFGAYFWCGYYRALPLAVWYVGVRCYICCLWLFSAGGTARAFTCYL